MNGSTLAALAALALLTVTPGADMALVTRNALAGGRAVALRTALGVVTGVLVWGLSAALGLASLVAASALAYDGLRLLGAAYLIWLGVTTLRGSRADAAREAPARPVPAPRRPFRQGLLTNLLNPKVGVFYSTFLPQFVGPHDSVLGRSLLLAAAHALMGIVWLVGYGTLVVRVGDVLRRPRVRAALDRLTGTVLVAFGLRLAARR